ncbi:MAG: hypothetical protein E3J87_00160 [Candidatus Cloacimonadota bacterium]|nr:MAG: hypothetical protein E3J87_00160 [Candidatus Cloacimonadota bacterium]
MFTLLEQARNDGVYVVFTFQHILSQVIGPELVLKRIVKRSDEERVNGEERIVKVERQAMKLISR